jgi:hypothetical protein
MAMIATYTEKRLMHRRTFDPHEDRLHIHVDEKNELIADEKYDLKDINPEFNILHVKDGLRDFIFIAASFACMICMIYYFSDAFKDQPNKLWWILAGLAFLFVFNAIGLLYPRRILFYWFKRNNGIQAFDIGRLGKYAHEYDEFVKALITQIKANQAKA